MAQIDLSDVTFTIPVRIDYSGRLENLEIVVNFLLKHYDTKILVGEESSSESKVPDRIKEKVDYSFYPTKEVWFYRTKILNSLAKLTKTPLIVNLDADVLFTVNQCIEAVNLIRANKFDLVLPFAGPCFNISKKLYERIRRELEITFISVKECHLLSPSSVGGVVFWKREAFFKGGMENENFKSWGYEDNERISRYPKLGYRMHRVKGNLLHLHHERGKDSGFSNPFAGQNKAEYIKVANMDKEHLKNYILTWSWTDK